MELSARLESLCQWIDGEVIADIGCDHAQLCIAAIQRNQARKAYACDVAAGPIAHARKNVKAAGMEAVIECRQQNGILPMERDVCQIVIAGMGALTMIEILQAAALQLSDQRLLLSPHKDAHLLRRWLQDNGYEITKEKVVQDGHFYPIIAAQKGSMTLSEREEHFGKNPQADKDYAACLQHSLDKYSKIAAQTPETKRRNVLHLLDLCQKQLETLPDSLISAS